MSSQNSYCTEQGFSLIEAITALTILAITLASAGLLFGNERLNNIKSEIRTEAVAFSQKILDERRRTDPSSLPNTGQETRTYTNGTGRVFEATIYYCENASLCQGSSRQIRVEVKNNGQTAYSVETVYTQFR